MPSLFHFNNITNEFTNFNSNILLGNSLFYSKRRKKNFDPVKDKILYELNELLTHDVFSVENEIFENTTSYNISGNKNIKTFEYDKNHTIAYNNLGGLYSTLNLENYVKDTTDIVHDKMDLYLIVEYIMENIEIDIIYKVTFFTISQWGDNYENGIQIDLVQRSLFSNYLGLFKIITIIIFQIFLMKETFDFFNELRLIKMNYDKWLSKKGQNITLQAKKTRVTLFNESFRKFFSIFDAPRILLFILIILGYLYLSFYIISIYKEISLFSFFDNYSQISKEVDSSKNAKQKLDLLYLIKNEFTNLSYSRDLLNKIASSFIFFGSLRISASLNVGIYFYKISTIIVKTLRRNLMIIILLILILPTFVFYGYLIFGTTIINYNTVGESFLINFIKIFSFEDDIPKDQETTGMIYIIGFTFTVKLMIGNLFISIINYSYKNIQSQLVFHSENFSLIKIIFYCLYKPNAIKVISNNETIEIEIDNFVNNKFYSEFDPVLSLESVEDFSNKEMEKMKLINDGLFWLEFSTREMKNAFDYKYVKVSFLDNNKYNNVDNHLLNIQYYANINFKMEIINSLEKEILDMKENNHKINVNYLMKKSSENSEENKIIERELQIEFKELTKDIYLIGTDIEELRIVNKKIMELDKEEN